MAFCSPSVSSLHRFNLKRGVSPNEQGDSVAAFRDSCRFPIGRGFGGHIDKSASNKVKHTGLGGCMALCMHQTMREFGLCSRGCRPYSHRPKKIPTTVNTFQHLTLGTNYTRWQSCFHFGKTVRSGGGALHCCASKVVGQSGFEHDNYLETEFSLRVRRQDNSLGRGLDQSS